MLMGRAWGPLAYLGIISKYCGPSAVIILIPATTPPDGEVMVRQGPQKMALSGRTDDGRGVVPHSHHPRFRQNTLKAAAGRVV